MKLLLIKSYNLDDITGTVDHMPLMKKLRSQGVDVDNVLVSGNTLNIYFNGKGFEAHYHEIERPLRANGFRVATKYVRRGIKGVLK